MKRYRLDEILIKNGLAGNKKEAFLIITEGRVLVNGQKAISPAQLVATDAKIEVREGPRYVGRGAYKLEAAIREFSIDVKDKICADIGSATGGFTEVLLKHGARRVYAIDTARGKLVPKLREDSRVVVMEGTDIRNLEKLPEAANLVTIDVSLISLRNILPAVRRFLKSDGEVIALFKPQYETRDAKILRHGVVTDTVAREKLLNDFMDWAKNSGWEILGRIESPIRGGEGNVEYLLWLRSS